MTTLKDTLFTRGAKACFAVLLAASLVPISALSSTPAFADDVEDDASAGLTTEVSDVEALAYNANGEGLEAEDASDGTPDLGEGLEGEPREDAAATAEGAPVEEPTVLESEDTVTDIQLGTLETTVEEPFSFFAPFRLLFRAASDGFTVPLKSGNYEKWIDRLDLSAAVDSTGANYAQRFYNILDEACDNDGTNDWLIDWGNPINLTTNGKIGGVYQVPGYEKGTVGILAAIIDNNESTGGSSSLTPTEQRMKEYINETYGAFDRDFPTSFWRDIQFGTVFWRPGDTGRSYCVFLLKSTSETTPLDVRAYGYQSPDDIRAGITALNSDISKIKTAYTTSKYAAQKSDYSRVQFYNEWLCENNQYNTAFGHGLDQATNPDVWSARSALEGRTGDTGPVCEGYARAMKVLCDSDGIGCVLVDGQTGPGPHMWNYVRMGSNWYGVDVTWNDSGAGASSSSYTQYLLKGSEFETAHPASNQFVPEGTKFTNGPQLAENDYDPNSVSFAGAITGLGPFAYGDEFALAYNSTTEGDAVYEVVSGPATKTDSSTPAESATAGHTTLHINGIGDIKVKVTLTPKNGGSALTDTITITAGPRPLKTTGTVLADKVYDGTPNATVVTAGTLASARTEPSYASVGVLDADKSDIGVNLKSGSAAFLSPNAAANQAAVVTYELTSPTNNADKLKLYTLDGYETENTTGTITKRPVTAYFALTNTRVLVSEGELPTPTVRFEKASGNRGKLDGDDLQPTNPNIKTTGMPATMPTDIPAGGANAYKVTWAMPNTSVLTEINKTPAAGNYAVNLSTDVDANTVTLVIANEENTDIVAAESPSGGATYRVECRINGINDDTVEALKGSGYTDATDITAKLLESLSKQTVKELSADRIAVYDMKLYVKDENGNDVLADESTFPSEGVRVTLDYPQDTKGTTHSFYAAHMFTHEVMSGGAVHKPGDIETPEVLNGPNGVFFTLMGFSPVSIAWEDVPRNTADDSGQGGGNGSGITTQVGQNTQQTGASNVSQTGDSLPVMAITVVALACVVLIVALMVRRNRNKNGEGKE